MPRTVREIIHRAIEDYIESDLEVTTTTFIDKAVAELQELKG